MVEYGIFLLMILVGIDVINTIINAKRLEDIMRTLKNSISEQIILSESRIENKIKKQIQKVR